jgi:glycosyltransferase involved in cell wall biosynthesis
MGKVKKIIKVGLKAAANPKHAHKTIKFAAQKRLTNRRRREEYVAWFERQRLTDDQLSEQKELAKKLAFKPLISVLVPTYDTDPQYLRECLDSVLDQTYTNWELCISDDASPSEATRAVIKEYVKKYKNIDATFNKTNGHIAVSSNVALGMAKGEYISLLDHDDLLLPNALYETVVKLNEHPEADLIYSDEDKLEHDSVHVEPFFKPDWSPDFLNSCNYITHFATLSAKILKKVNGFTPGTQGAQDWDLFLRVTAQTDKIYHIPKILYTWRKSETSTAQSADSKPYAYINQKKVLRNNMAARQQNVSVEAHPALGFWRVRYVVEAHPLVSIVIPTKDNYKLITQCVDSIIEKTDYPYFEVVIVDTGSSDPKVEEYYEKITKNDTQIRIVRWKKPFNFSGACNLGAEQSKGEYLLFLNNDTEVISPDWVQGLLEHAQRPGVGMVGAKLLFPNDTIQHAGVLLSERDIAFHPFYGQDPKLDIFSYIYLANVRNTSAVTAACSMVSRKKFNEVGGFDTKLRVTYNDVDLCLRLLDKGYVNVYNPFVELYHYESMSVGRIETSDRDKTEFNEAKALMQKRWAKYLKNDRYYNSCFEQYGPGYRLPVES